MCSIAAEGECGGLYRILEVHWMVGWGCKSPGWYHQWGHFCFKGRKVKTPGKQIILLLLKTWIIYWTETYEMYPQSVVK